MESLNNTIKGLEHCIDTDVTCDKCIYNKKHTRQCRKDNDALYHLKRYRSLLKMWNDKLDKEQQNKPLAWEELRQMGDKPVWWVHGEVGEWLTIYCVPSLGNGNDNVIYATTCSGVECWIWKKDLDKFQYYKKEK